MPINKLIRDLAIADEDLAHARERQMTLVAAIKALVLSQPNLHSHPAITTHGHNPPYIVVQGCLSDYLPDK